MKKASAAGSIVSGLLTLVFMLFWLAVGVLPFVLIFRGVEMGLLPQLVGIVLVIAVLVVEIWYFNKWHGPGD